VRLWLYAAIAAVLAGVVAPWQGADAGVPEQAKLASATGQIAWVGSHKYGVRFRFSGDPRTFDYPSKARGNGVVLDSLSTAVNKTVAVRYNPEPRKSLLVDGDVFDAWEIVVGGTPIRSRAESVEGWRADNALRPWLAIAFGFCAAYFAVHAWRRR
jgi:hypothetical protein